MEEHLDPDYDKDFSSNMVIYVLQMGGKWRGPFGVGINAKRGLC